MSRFNMLRNFLYFLAALFLFIAFSYLFFPVSRLNALMDSKLAEQGLLLSPGARKTFIPGLVWDKPLLASHNGSIFAPDVVNVHPDWLSLFTGTVAVSTNIVVNKGEIQLRYAMTGATLFETSINNLNLSDIEFFKSALNSDAGGMLWSEGKISRSKAGANGFVKLEIKNLSLRGVKLGAFPLPDVSGLTAQGMLAIAGGKGKLESFTLQGDGIYMRLSGDLPVSATSPLAMKLEIMPKPEFLEKQKLVFMLLAKFAVTPGVYQIPIKGNLLKPEII